MVGGVFVVFYFNCEYILYILEKFRDVDFFEMLEKIGVFVSFKLGFGVVFFCNKCMDLG